MIFCYLLKINNNGYAGGCYTRHPSYYVFDQKNYALIGYQKKISYQLGQKIEVKIKKVDLNRKQIDFIIV